MSLAHRVRDFRYAKGWGPDELASRAEISRTALYQIESGKTGLPRAGTLRRIAMALDITMDELIGHGEIEAATRAAESRSSSRRNRVSWIPSEGGPLTIPNGRSFSSLPIERDEEDRFGVESSASSASATSTLSVPSTSGLGASMFQREGDLMSKLHDLLHSHLGEGVARIVEDLHGLLARPRA